MKRNAHIVRKLLERKVCWTYFSRRDFMMSLADDMLTLIWSSKSQNAWTSSSFGAAAASCTSGVAIRLDGRSRKWRGRDLREGEEGGIVSKIFETWGKNQIRIS